MSIICLGLHSCLLIMYGCDVVMSLRGSMFGMLAIMKIGVHGVTTRMSFSFSVWWGLFVSGVLLAPKFSLKYDL